MPKTTLLALFSVLAICGETGMSEAAEQIRIAEGQLGNIAGHETGVISVSRTGDSARIMIAGSSSGAAWELVTEIRPREILPICGASVTVARIVPPAGSDRGAVAFAPLGAGPTAPSGDVCIPPAARLRTDGPSVMTATDFEPRRWQPNEQNPQAVEAEWYPAKFAREDTPDADVQHAALRPGSTARIGSCRATVVALERATDRHPAWLVLKLER